MATKKADTKSKKSESLLKAEKADKAAKSKAAKEKKEAAAAEKAAAKALKKAAKEKREAEAAEKAAEAASKELAKANKVELTNYSAISTAAYSKTWKKEELTDFVQSKYNDVKPFEINNKQIAFMISGTRVPSEGYFTVN